MIIDGITTADGTVLSNAELSKVDDSVAKGVILQVEQTYVDIISDQIVTANTRADIVNMTITLTPASINSRFLIKARWAGEFTVLDPWESAFGLRRNGTDIGLPQNVGNRSLNGMTVATQSASFSNEDSTPEAAFLEYVDAPGLTIPVTYTMTIRAGNTTGTLFNNRTVADIDGIGYERLTSSIIVMEIA